MAFATAFGQGQAGFLAGAGVSGFGCSDFFSAAQCGQADLAGVGVEV